MLYLKQSTASQSVLLGPFVDSTDGDTAETGLSIANTDIRLSKNGGNMAAKNSGGGTHDEAGWYTITLDATDTDTVGRLQLHCKMSGALMVHAEFQVLEETVYDALFAASAAGELAVKLSTQGKADVNAEADTALSDYDPPTKAEMDARTLASASYATVANQSTIAGYIDTEVAAIKAVTDNLPDSGALTSLATAAALATVDSNVDAILVDTGTTLPGILGTPAGLDMSADIAAVKSQTAAIETDTQNIQSRLPTALNNGAIPADVQRINDVEITGDGSATPFDVA